MGFDALTVRGWEEKPHYDKANNKVVWAISADDSQGTSVNYNTLALGRHGYMSMNLVADLAQLPELKPHAVTLLSNLNFVEGKRYADFNSTTDKVAAVGLAALVAGAAFKSGLLAKLLLLIVAFKKVILIAVAGGAAWIWKLMKSRSSPPPTAQNVWRRWLRYWPGRSSAKSCWLPGPCFCRWLPIVLCTAGVTPQASSDWFSAMSWDILPPPVSVDWMSERPPSFHLSERGFSWKSNRWMSKPRRMWPWRDR